MLALASTLAIMLSFADAPPAQTRVLLLAGGPTREYQFCRRLFLDEQDRKRAELTICLQGVPASAIQDVPAERLLADFPERLDGFDLIIAFDPNWSRLASAQRKELERWVKAGGGLILIAGPLFTRQVSDEKLGVIRDLYPVVIAEPKERTAQLPWRLRFAEKERPPFLKLDGDKPEALAGWDGFFGETGKPPPPEPDIKKVEKLVVELDDKDFEVRQRAQDELTKQGRAGIRVLEKLLRDRPPLEVRLRAEQALTELRQQEDRHGGFYDCHPVKDVKPTAVVLASFLDTELRFAGQDCPFLVTMSYDKGRIAYLGSGEMWRLRQFRVAYHERFWRELVKYVSGSSP